MTLQDAVVVKDTDATFTCKVNTEDVEVNWLLGNKEVPESDKYKVESEGLTHTLTIMDLTPEDSCEVTATIGQDKAQSTSARLSVQGKVIAMTTGKVDLKRAACNHM